MPESSLASLSGSSRSARAAARLSRFLLVTSLALLGGCAGTVPMAQGLAMRDVSFPLRDMRFPSGLRVLAEKDDRTPLAGLFLVVGAGSTSDPAGKEGLAHYIEHLAFRSRPFGKYSFRAMLERAGAGRWNAFTGLDDTVYYELGAASALPDLLRLEGTRMLAPITQLTPETLAIELNVVRNELRQRNETGFVGEVLGTLQAAVFPAGHPYRRPIIGTHESLSAIGPEDIAAFLKQHYRPDNMTLLILGNIDLMTIDRLVQESLPPELLAAPVPIRPAPRVPAKAPEPPDPPPASLERKEAAVATPELWIAWSLPRSFDTEAYLVDFLARAGDEQLSRGANKDDDIAFVDTSLVPGTQASMLVCRVALYSGAHPERSMDHVLNSLYTIWARPEGEELRKLKVDEFSFEARKRVAIVGMVREAENLFDHGVGRATITHFSQDPALYSRALRDVVALEPARLVDVAYKYLTRGRARAVLFTPPAGGSALPTSSAVSAPALDEEDSRPIRVDADRLGSIAPGLGASSYRQFVLPNGLEVILGRRAGLPLATVGLLFHGGVGEATDPAGAEAASWLAFPVERWHGSTAAFGGLSSRSNRRDSKTYYIRGAAGNVGIMLGILAERVRSMDITSSQWRWFQRYTVPFLRVADQKPETIGDRAFFHTLLAGHPYGQSVTGKDLEGTNQSAAEAWVEATHVPQNGVLAVVGEIEPELVEAMVREQFEGWKDGASALSAPAPPSLTGATAAAPQFVVTHRPSATQSQIDFGCLLPAAMTSALDTRHDVSAQLLQDRLFTLLREKLGVTYGLSANAIALRGGAAFLSVNGAVESGKLGPALVALRDSLKALADTKAPGNALAWAKRRNAYRVGTSFMTNDAVVASLLSSRNVGFPFQRHDTYARELDAVTAELTQQDFQVCAAGRPTLAIVGEKSAVQAALKEAWP
jgi:zinc protease